MRLTRLFRRPLPPERRVYEAIVAAARHPRLYAEWGVPDTVDGRFDMVTLYMFVVLDRLKGDAAEFRQRLTDTFFADMDRALREMGVGDLSVAKKIRKMAEVFYGRVAAYDAALSQSQDAMTAALARNVYAGATSTLPAGELAAYVDWLRQRLARQSVAAISAGTIELEEA